MLNADKYLHFNCEAADGEYDPDKLDTASDMIYHHVKTHIGNQFKPSAQPGYVPGSRRQRGRKASSGQAGAENAGTQNADTEI